MSEQQQYTIPSSGPFIYDFGNRSVRSVEIKTTMQGWAESDTQAPENEEGATSIEIQKSEDGPIDIKATHAYGSKYEQEFTATVSNSTDSVNLSWIGDNNIMSIAWEAANNYPVREWYIPLADILLITVNKT